MELLFLSSPFPSHLILLVCKMWILINKFLLIKITSILSGGDTKGFYQNFHRHHRLFSSSLYNQKREKKLVFGILMDLRVYCDPHHLEVLLSDFYFVSTVSCYFLKKYTSGMHDVNALFLSV